MHCTTLDGIGQVSPMLLVISVTCSDPISAQVNTVVQPVILSLALGLRLAGTGFEAHYCFVLVVPQID